MLVHMYFPLFHDDIRSYAVRLAELKARTEETKRKLAEQKKQQQQQELEQNKVRVHAIYKVSDSVAE